MPAALAAVRLSEDRFHSAGLSCALDLPLAPGWLVGAAAVCAVLMSLFALFALCARVAMAQPAPPAPAGAPAARPMAEAGSAAD